MLTKCLSSWKVSFSFHSCQFGLSTVSKNCQLSHLFIEIYCTTSTLKFAMDYTGHERLIFTSCEKEPLQLMVKNLGEKLAFQKVGFSATHSLPSVIPASGPQFKEVVYVFYVPETHIMYFIRCCWFLKCSEEGLLVGVWGCYWLFYKIMGACPHSESTQNNGGVPSFWEHPK